ncbi:right-handed parallel beta-helix repeat-containing protein [Saccharothrix sp. 6-C]|nr:right-handed parallel beta-helix repeat-containing protein [Saccharothrix sp. 6-C]
MLAFLIPVTAAAAPVPSSTTLVECANTMSDGEQLNAAIRASLVGVEIVISGRCSIDSTIRLLGDRSYHGMSRTGTVIRQADGANLAALVASDSYLDDTDFTGDPVTLRSLTLEGNREANPRAGDGLVLRSWASVVDPVPVLGANRHGIRVTNPSANGTLLGNTQVNGRISACHVAESGGSGIRVEDPGNAVTDWQLTDNWIASAGAAGISLDNTAGWYVERNHVYDVAAGAIAAERLFGSSVSDNCIEDFAGFGIRASAQGEAASTVAHNRVVGTSGEVSAFVSVRINYGAAAVAVVANTLRDSGTRIGLDYQAATGTTATIASTGNLVTGVTTPRRVSSGVTVTTGI